MPCPITRAALGRVAGSGLTGRQNIFCRSTRIRVLWMGIPFGEFGKSRRSFQESRNTGSSEPSSNESDAFGGPAAIPITPDLISAHPIKSILMIGERRAGKDKREATIRVWDVRDHAIAIIASAELDPRQCSIAACIRKPSHDGRSHLTVMAIFFEITGGLNR